MLNADSIESKQGRGVLALARLFGFALIAYGCLAAAWFALARHSRAHAAEQPATILVDYPLNGSIFPPDFVPPAFEWRDPSPEATNWQITIDFGDGSPALHATAAGERMKIGPIDERCIGATNKLPELTPEQSAARTWRPGAEIWTAVRAHAVGQPATVTIRGFRGGDAAEPVSSGSLEISISRDPVGAPVFYRDVPLMPSAGEKGVIKPLDSNAVPLIAWRMRNLAEPESHVVMTGLHSCANCHSFSADGRTLGLDMDGPRNDKGLYAIVPIGRQMSVRNQDMISWASFAGESNPQLRIGFMSQLSPDGKFVMTTIKPPGTRNEDFYYVSNFTDYRFLQVFYPTRGILSWYDRAARTLKPLPGADDPAFVQASAVWSPDGKYLVFERAKAQDASPPGLKMAAYANDPAEMPVRYDLYRIPFNGGRGGKAEPIAGASANGKSNSFPKVSPDGKWIVYVQARNGLLMRPDSELWIVPAAGGTPRRMRSNTARMNSWHSFSPNGRWMVFSSKSRSPYTQMFLTHIDEQGNDSPAILVENSTAANRAVNLPEFVNMDPAGIEHIDTPAVDFYKQFDAAAALVNQGRYPEALTEWKKALEMQPEDVSARFNYAETLLHAGEVEQGVEQLQRTLRLNPHFAEAHNNLGVALGFLGRHEEAEQQLRLALSERPDYAEAHTNLGSALVAAGRTSEAEAEYNRALAIDPASVAAEAGLGHALLGEGSVADAMAHLRHAVALGPENASVEIDLGIALAKSHQLEEAIPLFEKALVLEPGSAGAHYYLGKALVLSGRGAEGLEHWKHALSAEPDHLQALNDMAWVLATAEDASLRNGAEALPLAEHAVELTANQEPAILGTLAAVYGELGQFDRAVELATQAASLAEAQNKADLAQLLRQRLELLRNHSPIRQ